MSDRQNGLMGKPKTDTPQFCRSLILTYTHTYIHLYNYVYVHTYVDTCIYTGREGDEEIELIDRVNIIASVYVLSIICRQNSTTTLTSY